MRSVCITNIVLMACTCCCIVVQQIKEVAGKLDVEMMVIQGEDLDQKGFGGDICLYVHMCNVKFIISLWSRHNYTSLYVTKCHRHGKQLSGGRGAIGEKLHTYEMILKTGDFILCMSIYQHCLYPYQSKYRNIYTSLHTIEPYMHIAGFSLD